jgi:hypothetical protein
MSDKSFERARQGRRRRRVLRAAIGNVTPMSLIGTFETWRPALTMSVSGSSRPTTKMTRLTLLGHLQFSTPVTFGATAPAPRSGFPAHRYGQTMKCYLGFAPAG